MPNATPIHMNAKKEDVAENVIFPGDPLRAKYIAENFLEDAKEITNVRNMLGFTGMYKGSRVTVMSSGMGMPSCGIYAFELFYYYNVQNIIRIGTCGVIDPSVKIPEILLADQVYSQSNYAFMYNGYTENIVDSSPVLVNKIMDTAENLHMKIHKGTLMTSDVFDAYANMDPILERIPENLHVLGIEMEAFGLIHIAHSFKRNAACLVTAVDSKFTNKALTPEERQTSLNDMIRLVLETISSSNK